MNRKQPPFVSDDMHLMYVCVVSMDYIRFYHLRSYDRINAPLSTTCHYLISLDCSNEGISPNRVPHSPNGAEFWGDVP